ncbi:MULTISPECIES: hypothetical protein [unclassified Desulfovibrio]|uniref:hypothetical protein n=1 Tax=unclassified Desulfovibrio TaxID=2593640 RepID=UPI002FD8E10C
MSHPPHKPPHESSEGHARHDDTLPAVSARHDGRHDGRQDGRQDGNGHSGDDQRRVLEAEVILDDGQEQQNRQDQTYGQEHGRGNSGSRGFFYSRTFGGRGAGGFQAGGSPLGHIWISQRNDANACLAPCVTFAIFLVCLAQFGFLAGLGFVFFHTLGSIAGTLRQMRGMTAGRVPNPWLWRFGNWLFSFLVTVWLAGGFN